jgi:chromosome segregation ATPase
MLYIEAVSAFTSTLSSTSQRHPSKNGFSACFVSSLPRNSQVCSKMTLSENNNNEAPHPPDYPPRIDEQLEEDLMDSQRRVMLYEKEVEMIREQLELKQDELLDEQNIFRDEKFNLMGKIAEFTNILSKRDDELVAATSASEEEVDLEKQADLENKIESLLSQLTEKTDSLENEKRSNEELRKRFDDADDALEFEQMNFEKERNALQELVTEERKQVKSLQGKFEENSKSFETTRDELLKKIQNEENMLSDTKNQWRETQDQLRQVEEKLEITLQEKSKILKENEINLDTEKTRMSFDMVNLKNQIEKDQVEMKEMKNKLEEENKVIRESTQMLESQIEIEQNKIKDLQELLKDEQSKYYAGKTASDEEIQNVTANLENVENQLSNERANFSKEKDMLEKKLANEIRVGKLKKKEMKNRYDEIRNEMTNLWNSSKRQARQEENRLRKKYNLKLDTVKSQVAKLEKDLIQEKDRLVVTKTEMESKHMKDLEVRDASIVKLEGSVVNLRKLIIDKDQIIEEKNEQIKSYETSFRQLAKLGMKVTGNKVKKVAGPLKRFIQNPPPSDD